VLINQPDLHLSRYSRPCPVVWDFDTENTVRLARMAVEARVFSAFMKYQRDTTAFLHRRTTQGQSMTILAAREDFPDGKRKRSKLYRKKVNNFYDSLIEKSNKGL